MASGSKTTSSDKKKTKKSSRSSAEVSSRKKDRTSKDKKSSSKKKNPAATTESANAPPSTVTTPPLVHDPDAIQLFRRYDRNRSSVLTRIDFLQLLRDYADPPSGYLSRPPLSLTYTSGIPLGYQRAAKNSEFEAGQLFERYDKDHTGALNLDKFHVFFADFKPQLRAFVEESNYRLLAPPVVNVAPALLSPVQEEESAVPPTIVRDAASGADDNLPSPKTIRGQYRAAFWKLRKICKNELYDQREDIVQQMKTIRENMSSRQRESTRSRTGVHWEDSRRSKRRPRASLYPEFDEDHPDENGDDGEAKRYEAMEDDLDRLDELIRHVRRFLNKGDDVSHREMQDFIEQAESIEEEAQSLAMKDYGKPVVRAVLTPTNKKENDVAAPPISTSTPDLPSSTSTSDHHQKQTDLQSLLRVKDQMIYQLLQERTSMRKERAAVEASLKKLSDVSTREMKKWARLTDDMQAEIEQLRTRLRSQS